MSSSRFYFTEVETNVIRNLKFMIIGGCGFIGSHIAQLLVAHSSPSVVVIDTIAPRRIHSLLGKDRFNYYKYDVVKDKLKITDIIENEKIDVVMYFTNDSLTRMSFEHTPELFLHELKKFENVLEMSKEWAKCLVYQSSKYVYSPLNDCEKINTNPHERLGMLYKCFEVLAHTTSIIEEFNTVGIRVFDVYGPTQRYKTNVGEDELEVPIISRLINQALGNKKLLVQDPKLTINPLYIEDCAVCSIKVAVYSLASSADEKSSHSTIVDLGGASICINELCELITKISKSKSKIDKNALDDEMVGYEWLGNQLPPPQLDNNDSTILTQLNPIINASLTPLKPALSRTIEHYRGVKKNRKMIKRELLKIKLEKRKETQSKSPNKSYV